MNIELINSLDTNTIYLLAIAHCLIGIIAAIIAKRKGYNFPLWLLFGLIGGTPILILALLKKNLIKDIN